jgi:hypothetical protein
MTKQYSFLVLAAITLVVLTTLIHAEFDPRDYCGVPPAPAKIPDIPTLNSKAHALGLKLVDFYTFTRHGDRSTLTKDCFANLPEFRDRKWVECPKNTLASHTGLSERNPYAPLYVFPIHPYPGKQILNGNCHLGQLTQRGLLMSYNNGFRVGKYLDQQYSAIGHEFNPTDIKMRSTDVHRTRETAEGFVTGLLDNMKGKQADLQKQLPPLFFVDSEVDAQKLNNNVCNTTPYINKVYSSPAWIDYQNRVWYPLLKQVREVLQQPNADLNDVFDCIKPYHCHGLKSPQDLAPLHNQIEEAVTEYWRYGYFFDHKESSQLFSGYLLLELSALFSESATKSANSIPTVNFWSGHDFGPISNLAAALTFPDFLWPPYSAMINIEFYRSEGVRDNAFVRFLYLGQVVVPDFCKDAIVVNELCPTDIVLEFIKSLLPTAQQCPRIPRSSYDFSKIKNNLVQNKVDEKVVESVYGLFDTIDTFDRDLGSIQEQMKFFKQKRGLSHTERWSQFV